MGRDAKDTARRTGDAGARYRPISAFGALAIGVCVGLSLPHPVEAAPSEPVIGCASLANLRILMREAKADVGAAAAILGDDRADHLGCVVLARETVTAVQEHLSLNGNAYDCLSLRSTSVCQWVAAGAVSPNQPPAKARQGEKARSGDKSQQGAEKARR